ncbi:MAG TPA: FtsX-like permease family protein [Streptosporangiaceae bacterium]
MSEKALFVAACLTALLATTVLVALAGYASSVTDGGARRTLERAPADRVETRIAARVTGASYARAERVVAAGLARAFPGVPLTSTAAARGDSYTLPGQQRERRPRLTAFAMYSRIAEHATLIAGAWPRPVAGAVEAALPAPAARATGMSVGGVYTVRSRLDGRATRVRITGLFKVNRAGDPFWDGDSLVITGAQALSYTTFGPLVVAPETFVHRFAATGVTVRWLVEPDVRAIAPHRFGDLADRASGLNDRLRAADPGTEYIVATEFPQLLAQLASAALVSRSTMAIPIVQLLVLAGYALVLVARLLAEHRRMEVAALRARGASLRQLSMLTAGEGILFSLPAVAAAPLLAPALLHLAGSVSIIKATGLRLGAGPSPAMWAAAAVAGAGCAVALTLPAVHGVTRSYVAAQAARGRGDRRGWAQRAGADLALAVVAALGIWQLIHYGGPVTEARGGALGIDPFIVAGPALALLAGGALALRVVPIAARAAARTASRRGTFAPALGAWQVSRRPVRYSGPALLLVMAIAVGVLTVTAGVTWRRSQIDQADFQAGADLRVTPSRDGKGPAPAGQGGAFGSLPGVTAASPVLRTTSNAGNQEVTLLAVDTTKTSALLGPRSDRSPRALPAVVTPGGRGAAPPPAAALPGRQDRLAVDVRIVPPPGPADPRHIARNRLSLLVVDALGVDWTVDLGGVRGDGRFHRRTADLGALAGPGGRLSHPLSIRGFRYDYPEGAAEVPLTLSLRLRGAASAALRPPPGAAWTGTFRPAGGGVGPAPSVRPSTAGVLTVELPRVTPAENIYIGAITARGTVVLDRTGQTGGTSGTSGAGRPPPMPGIITTELARRARVGVGGRLTLDEPAGSLSVAVAGIVPALPSTAPGEPGVLVDWRAYTDQSAVATGLDSVPTEWWLATGGDTGPAVRALARHPEWTGGVVDRMALRRELRDAPLGAALQGALVLGFLAALGLAVVGFAVNAAVSARERRAEFAVLRALGVSARQVFGMLGVEQVFLVLLGLAGGLALGLAIGRVVIPHSVLTVRATAPYPQVRLVVPWPPILALLVGVPALLAVVLAVLVRLLRRHGLGATIRIGEDH